MRDYDQSFFNINKSPLIKSSLSTCYNNNNFVIIDIYLILSDI